MSNIPFEMTTDDLALAMPGPFKFWGVKVAAGGERGEQDRSVECILRRRGDEGVLVRFAFSSFTGVDWGLSPFGSGPVIVLEGRELLMTFKADERVAVSGVVIISQLS